MEKNETPNTGSGWLLRLSPFQRISLSIFFAAIVWFIIRGLHESALFLGICAWCSFAFSYLITSWIVLTSRKIHEIKKIARKEDGSRLFVLLFIIIVSFAAVVSVLILVISSGKNLKDEYITVPVSFFSVLVSWALVHTIFTFHYATLFYDDHGEEAAQSGGGIDFPGNALPDFLDFAYFSFVIGMTFQVSDVEVSDKKIRRIVLAHGLISFVLNTFVVALTVNFIAGLKK